MEGVVKDNLGEPIPGAAVVEKGTSNGTATNLDGRFKLTLNKVESTVRVSFIGYTTIEKRVKGGTKVEIILNEENNTLDEITVIGYGAVKKSDLTGAVSSVKSEVMTDRMVLSMEDALKGKVAGVSVISTDGAPGAPLNIRIRGVSSINASNSPLYVVDGVLMESTDISPSEIESMEILKDASSTAIYGSRGANGVVVITTKRGVKGRAKIELSTSFSVQTPVSLYQMANAEEYAKYCILGYGPSIGAFNNYYTREGALYKYAYSGNYVDRYNKILSGELTTNTDWQNAILRDALVQENKINISGGDDNGSYSIMGSTLAQDGIVIESGIKRYNIRTNFDRKVIKGLKVGVNISGSISDISSVAGNVIQSMLSQPPTKAINEQIWEAEEGENTIVNNNPFLQARKITNDTKRSNLMLRGYADYSFLKMLRLNISGSYNYTNSKDEIYYPSDVNIGNGNTLNGRAQTNIREAVNWLNENLLYITPKKMGKHSLDALVGLTFQGNNNYSLNTENNNFTYEELGTDNMGYGLTPVLTTNNYTDSRMMSLLGRINYKFNEKYLFTVSARADGSSRLAAGNKWGYFPSGAFAWRMSEEKFIKNLNVFSNLKLRASAGVSGNTGISPYQTLPTVTTSGYPMNGIDPTLGLIAERTANPGLEWETSTQYDLGLDMGGFNNRLTATIDLYLKKTRDLLLQESIPTYLGYSTRWINRGKVDNKGLEITLNGVPVSKGNFLWTSSFNIAFNRSKVGYISESGQMVLNSGAGGATNFGLIQAEQPIGLWYGYKESGVFKSQKEIDTSGIKSIFGNTPRLGFVNYEDFNNDGEINESDRQILGNSEPKFTGGFTNNFTYKGIELHVAFEYRYGGKVFNSTRMRLEGGKGVTNITKRSAQYGYVPTLYYTDSGLLFMQGNEDIAYLRTPVSPNEPTDYTCRSTYLENASYLRLDDVRISYSLPSKLLRRWLLSTAKIYVSVKNAFVLTDYTGYDPDVNSTSGSSSYLLPGIDDNAYPRTRSYSMGLSLSF